ncbi:MAG: dephospho-CoA kinase [Candidatus Omnitrophota bacterium]|nr:MAG: dephospho-CoA kinase [Candidatus Omnitrophota bacterium]
MKKKILVLGITGSFASGKSSVAEMFRRLGARIIDADKIYHRLIKPPNPLYKKIVSVFGQDILRRNKYIDRKKLAERVFTDKEALNKLSQITHPVIIKEIKRRLKKIKPGVVIIDAPLLIEAGLNKIVDKLIVVKINRKNQVIRCREQRGLSGDEIAGRNRAQVALSEKIKLADYVIDNNGTFKQTNEQVDKIWKKISVKR